MACPSQPVIPSLSRDQFIFPKAYFLLLGLLAFGCGSSISHAETPAAAVDRIWHAWGKAGPGDDPAQVKKFRLLLRTVAQEQGTAIIPAILAKAKDWHGEEVLIYMTVFADLPRDASEPVLTKYKEDGKPWERQAADDVLIELDSSDFKAALKQLQNQ